MGNSQKVRKEEAAGGGNVKSVRCVEAIEEFCFLLRLLDGSPDGGESPVETKAADASRRSGEGSPLSLS